MPDPEQRERAAPAEVEGSPSPTVSYDDLFKALISGYGPKSSDEDGEHKKRFDKLLADRLRQEAEKHACTAEYNVLTIFDNTRIVKTDSDRIYAAIRKLPQSKPLLLILLSKGGDLGSAYLIGQLCRESCNGKFVIVIPRYAKSAATLLATAANEIHMGSLSELGPIDPQMDNMPALGLKNSVEHIAELVKKVPASAEMFAKYLHLSVKPIQIGYYERVAESAMQYAERLLAGHKELLDGTPEEIARKLVYGYKDHRFVIDKLEAEVIFGRNTIKSDSAEYGLGNSIYAELSDIEELANIMGYSFYFIGSLDDQPTFTKRNQG